MAAPSAAAAASIPEPGKQRSHSLPGYPPGVYTPTPMPHTPAAKKKVLVRVRRIRGQTDALERALDAGDDCAVVLQQLAAIRGAINGLMSEVLEAHLHETFGGGSDDPRHAQRVQEMTALVRTYLK